MKRVLAIFATGFALGLLVAPESGKELRRRLRRLWARRAQTLRYQWREPDDRMARAGSEIREKMMDKTLADSFPASDPPSSIPDPSEDSIVA